MGRELLKLLQNYSKTLNERQSYSEKSQNYDYEYSYEESKPRPRKAKRSKKQENYEDQWTKAWNDDSKLVNDMFGFEEPKKKSKRQQSSDYGFNVEDFFS